MKLMYCLKCHDVLKILKDEESCLCGLSTCWFKNKFFIKGPSLVICLDNKSLNKALENRRKTGKSSTVEAFVLPKKVSNVIHVYPKKGKPRETSKPNG